MRSLSPLEPLGPDTNRKARPISMVRDITDFAMVLEPEDAPAPILSRGPRAAVHQWMTELTAEEELKAVGIKPRNTAMFFGPPGCGKTTLAHHIAGRFGVPLVLVDLSALISQWVGGTGQNLHRLMTACRERARDMILLLDEFDAIGTRRGSSSSADKEKANIVIHLLQAVDRYPGILIAATNRQEDIDPALWRRFGLNLIIDAPDDDARYAIIKRYLAPFVLPESSMEILNDATIGAMPELIQKLMEGVKRDLILSPRFKYPVDAASVMDRILAMVKPHSDLPVPPLWQDDGMRYLDKIEWPPVMEAKAA